MVLYRYFPVESKEKHEDTPVRISDLRAEIWTGDLPNTKRKY
jgi:hypothetical protein